MIKQELAKLGAGKGYYVCASGVPEADHGEWLYDLCWLKYPKNKHERERDEFNWHELKHVALAMESEWGASKPAWNLNLILEDYQKLVQSRARLKLMAFQVRDKRHAREVFDALRQYATSFGLAPREKYLLASWCWEKRDFLFEAFGTSSKPPHL